MTSLPSTKQYSVMLSLKQIAKVAQLTVPKVNYRLRLHSEELSKGINWDDVRSLKKAMKALPKDTVSKGVL